MWLFNRLQQKLAIIYHLKQYNRITVAIESIGQFTGMYDSFGKRLRRHIPFVKLLEIYTDFLVVYNNRDGKFQNNSGDKTVKYLY